MSSNRQQPDPVAPSRVSVLVEGAGGAADVAGIAGGLSHSATHGHGGGGSGGSMIPGSDEIMDEGISGPTAIPADEGDVAKGTAVGSAVQVNTSGDGCSGGVDTVTPRDGDAAHAGEDDDDDEEEKSREDDDVADDESDYSYTYEDEDEGHYSGFLIPTEPFETAAAHDSSNAGAASSLAAQGNGVNIVASEDPAASAPAGEVAPRAISRAPSRVSDSGAAASFPGRPASPVPETNPRDFDRKQKWREPTRAAVNMSLRAEKEKTGGRRRLASDLYKIMMADTKEAGFSLEPADEDSMDKWRIRLFGFDEDSNLAKDLLVCGMDHVELEMSFPDQYPFEPPFVRVVAPRFKRQTGFVMSGALCMELLTKDGWNPINDIESVIVSIRSLMVVGDGRLQAAADMGKDAYKKALETAEKARKALREGKTNEEEDGSEEDDGDVKMGEAKRKRAPSDADDAESESKGPGAAKKATGGTYSAAEAQSAYDHLSKYHKKEGWDKSGWWSRKG